MTATRTAFAPDTPTITFTYGTEYDVLPDDGQPLRYFRTAYARLEQHTDYTGDYRPSRITVNRVERNGDAPCNVCVNFEDDRGVSIRTWVHHSFLVPVGAAVGEVTIDQKVAALSAFMQNEIGNDDWPDAGNPSEWDEGDWLRWCEQGNRAIIERRAEIESGSVTAGFVWCAANADDFSFDYTTEEYLHNWFVRHRGDIDAIFARLQPVAASARAWDQGRVLGTKQTVYTPDGEVGLVLDSDNRIHTNGFAGQINVYKRNGGRWTNSFVPEAQVDFAVAGDPIINHEITGLFVRNDGDEMIVVTVNGVEASWRRQDCRYTGQPGVAAPEITDLIKVVDGVEYIRKDVIDADVERHSETFHKGSVENNLCGVYDRVAAQADARTTYVKYGERYKPFTVTIRETLTVERVMVIDAATDSETAICRAREQAANYPLRNIPTRVGNETVTIVGAAPTTDHTPVAVRRNR